MYNVSIMLQLILCLLFLEGSVTILSAIAADEPHKFKDTWLVANVLVGIAFFLLLGGHR